MRFLFERATRGGGPGALQGDRLATNDQGRQWQRVHFKSARRLGTSQRGDTRVQSAGQANRQRFHRKLQRQTAAGVFESELVYVLGRGQADSGSVARGLQRISSTQLAGSENAERICGRLATNSNRSKSRIFNSRNGPIIGEASKTGN